MHTRWLSASSVLFLIACGGQSSTDGTGGAGAQAGAGGSGASSGSGGGGGSGAVAGGTGGYGAGGAGGSTGGAPGGGGAPCSALNDVYAEALMSAKICNPFIDMNECTAQMPDALACPCASTFVNPGNAEAIQTLNELQAQWNAQKCYEGIGCPAIACEQPALGSCQLDASGSTGSCEDMYTNDPGG